MPENKYGTRPSIGVLIGRRHRMFVRPEPVSICATTAGPPHRFFFCFVLEKALLTAVAAFPVKGPITRSGPATFQRRATWQNDGSGSGRWVPRCAARVRPIDRTSNQKSVRFARAVVGDRSSRTESCPRGDRMRRGERRSSPCLPEKEKGNSRRPVPFSVAAPPPRRPLTLAGARNGTEMVLPKRRCSPPRARAMSLVNLRLTRHHARVIYLCLGFNVVSEGKKLLG
jgi:hypothetical protein